MAKESFDKQEPAQLQRLEKIFEHSSEHVSLVDADGQIIYSNNMLQKMLGYGNSEISSTDIENNVHPDEAVAANAFYETVRMQANRSQKVQIRQLHKEGHYVWIEIHGVNLLDEPDVKGILYQWRDISIQKEQERLNRYHAILQENVMDAVIVTDMTFKIQSWNLGAERLYGWRADEVVNRATAEILQTIFSSDAERDIYVHELLTKGEARGEFRQKNRAGEILDILASVTTIRDEENKPFAVVSINRDMTKKRNLERALDIKHEEELELQSYLKILHEANIELSLINNLDDFYKRAVELGLSRFGFERIGLLLYDSVEDIALGTYGTNVQGRIVSESHIRLEPQMLTGILKKTLEAKERFVYEENTALYDTFNYIGQGWNAVATLWNGEESLGWLAVDNGLKGEKATKTQLDILALYAANLGSILSQKRISLALKESEARFRMFMEDAPIAIVVSNKEGKILLVNGEAEELLGYQRQELVGQAIEILVPEGQRKGHQAKRDSYTEKPHKRTMGNVMELFVRRKDGGFFWADIQLSYIQLEDDLLIMAFIEDISERKLAEEALKLYATEVEDLYNNAPCGYHSLDSNGLIVAMNDTELQWLGYEREEILGRLYFTDIISPADMEGFTRSFPQFKERGWVNDLEFEFIRKDGTSFFVSLSATAVRDDNGHYVMSRSTVFDISERKEAQRLLEQALAKEKELGELKTRFVSMASHEFRTPLSVIKTSTDLVLKHGDKQGMDWSKQKLGRISEQIQYLTNIMNDVLNLGRLQSGKTDFNPTMGNFVELCRKILEEFRARPDISHLFLEEIAEGLPDIRFDNGLMRQLISNLLSNAVKYSPDDKPVGLKLWEDGKFIVLEVHDKGIGIPEADLPHLFEPFHRAANVSGIQGTGMGLSITKEIAEKHGGTIEVESVVKQGTRMIVRLPLPG